jgi:hypothetical protein
MPIQSRNDVPIAVTNRIVGKLPGRAIVVVIAGITAAWIAAGSVGFLGNALCSALTCIALGVAILAAWPWPYSTWKSWAIPAVGILAGLALNCFMLPGVNIFGVVLILATLAYIHGGLTGRVILLSSLAIMTLAVYRLALTAVPMVWQLADVLGWGMGKLVGALTGRPLTIGATFGGLDFLVVMIALYIGWLCSITTPRRRAGIYAGLAIAASHIVYLTVLAYSEKIAALLPAPLYVEETDISRVGAWAWQNTARGMLPWNLPVLAAVLYSMVVTCMFRWAGWMRDYPDFPIKENGTVPFTAHDPKKNVPKYSQDEIIELRTLFKDAVFILGPIALAILIAFLTVYSTGKSDLRGKTVVAYEKGNFNWFKPTYGNSIIGGYGMLPIFVESLGGRFAKSPDLSQKDLDRADVVIVLHPNSPFTSEQLKRLENYVRQGGSLLLGAENYSREAGRESHFNELLTLAGIEVNDDASIPLSANWEQCRQAIFHPAALDFDDYRNSYGLGRGSSIRLKSTSRPVIAGRWAWSIPGSDAVMQKSVQYREGQPLGDLVLAAEKPLGMGRIVVLGDMACMNNERLSCSWEFVGRLLSYLANHSSSPQADWRQISAIAAMILFIVLLIMQPDPMRLAVACLVFAVALIWYAGTGDKATQVLPDGRDQTPGSLAYIDTSHLEAFSSDLWNDYGIAGFTRVLMRSGFLPLRLPEISAEHLERAKVLVLMAPARQFSDEDKATVRKFVEEGGTLIILNGAEDVRASADLLKEFQFNIDPSPVGPREAIREPDPLGALALNFLQDKNTKYVVQFFAAWPIEKLPDAYKIYIVDKIDDVTWPVVAKTPVGQGMVLVVADTYFAINQNLESAANEFPSNMKFWRMLLSDNTGKTVEDTPDELIKEQGLMDSADKPGDLK